MTTSKEFASYCCDLLASAGPCVAKRMFGGFGISTAGLNIALLVDLGGGDKLWLKADNLGRSRYEAAGCARFTYDTKHGPRSVDYYSTPEEAMDSPDTMRPWAALALECALRARAAKPVAKPRAQSAGVKRPLAKVERAQKATKTVVKRATAPAPKPKAARKSTKA
jgi:DNA transformation protein and related proteins